MSSQPNIVFYFSDQQRWDTCGCYGQKLNVTPNLDRMAAEGVRFERAFTCQPVCGPARACIQTGKWATETGCFRNHRALPQDEKTIAHWCSEAGYDLAYVGKWHLASQDGQDFRTIAVPQERRGGWNGYWMASDVLEFTSHGYDGYVHDSDNRKVEFKGYRVDCITDFALDWLRTRDDARPFFLFISYIEPHHQNDRNRYEGPNGSEEKFKDYEVPGDLAGTAGDWRPNYPDYLGCCNSLDHNLGRIRAELDRQGIAGNTLVFYTSDHGSHFRTRNAEYKRACHDGCLRIPMIASGPGFTGGRVVSELVSLIDVPPTLLAAAGITPPPTMRGRPLQELAAGRLRLAASRREFGAIRRDWPREVFYQISESKIGRGIRTEKWKYSVSVPGPHRSGSKQPAGDVYQEEYQYDLENDPHERWNLVGDPGFASVRAELAEALKRRMSEAGEGVPRIALAALQEGRIKDSDEE